MLTGDTKSKGKGDTTERTKEDKRLVPRSKLWRLRSRPLGGAAVVAKNDYNQTVWWQRLTEGAMHKKRNGFVNNSIKYRLSKFAIH